MRLRVALAAVAAACLLALAPFTIGSLSWQTDPARYPKVVAWTGCTARVVLDDGASPVESFYTPGAHVIVVGTHEDAAIPYYAGLFVLLHETGHCLQDQEGLLDLGTARLALELDADRRASDLACGLGLDGRRISKDTWDWAHDTFGYNGDPGHGSLDERRHQADLAHACDKRPGL